jgi:hypothetical protein
VVFYGFLLDSGTVPKNLKYHTVGTVPESNRKTLNTTLLEQFQNLAENIKYYTVGIRFFC